MFERYTERARRVLFFARYESSQLGALSIETEHLLLGLLREGKGVTRRLIEEAGLSPETLRNDVLNRRSRAARVPTSVEIPFSDQAKQALQYAAEEADGLEHSYIGTEHLLLGLLRDESSLAGSVLVAHGLHLDAVRQQLRDLVTRPQATPGAAMTPVEHVHAIEGIKIQVDALARLVELHPGLASQARALVSVIHEALDRLKPPTAL